MRGHRIQSVALEVVHWNDKLTPETRVEVMAPISEACVRGLRLYNSNRNNKLQVA